MEYFIRMLTLLGTPVIFLWNKLKGAPDYRKYCPNPGCGKQMRVNASRSDVWFYHCDACDRRYSFPAPKK